MPIVNSVDSIEARFVRITVTGADVYTGTWVSLTELRVFGEGEQTYSSVNDTAKKNVKISPNPATAEITIESEEVYDLVSVYDQSGRKLIQSPIKHLVTLDVSELQSGIYIVRLEGNYKPHVLKFVKL